MTSSIRISAAILSALAVTGMLLIACSAVDETGPSGASRGAVERGKATWYGGKYHGRKTASGERFDKRAMTAAHKKLPFGTVVLVTNQRNGRSVELRINDRGPYGKGRIIDVSEAAARKLNMIRAGVVPVTVKILKRPPPRTKRRKRRR